MRITLVVDRYYPFIGGIEQYVRGLSMQLTGDGHNVTIITAPAPRKPQEEEAIEGLIIRSSAIEGASPNPGKALSNSSQIAREIARAKPDVVYANNHASLGAIRAAQSLGLPVVYGCHGWGLMCPSKIRFLKPTGELCHAETSLKSCLSCYAAGPAPLRIKGPGFIKQTLRTKKYLGYHDILNSADARIGVSRLTASMFREQRNTHAIYPGVDLNAYRPVSGGEFRRRHNISGDYIFVPGRVNAIKGQIFALRALAECALPLTMVFAGNVALDPGARMDTGAYGKELRDETERLGLAGRIIFTGMLDQPEMAAAYSGARATIVPSVWLEPFGYVAAESMACGTPVIITSNSGAAELVDDSTGQVVPREDSGAIALALERVVPLSGQMGATARARAEERLGWSRVAQQVLSVLEDAIVRRAVSGQRAA